MEWNHKPFSKLQWFSHWNLGMKKSFHLILCLLDLCEYFTDILYCCVIEIVPDILWLLQSKWSNPEGWVVKPVVVQREQTQSLCISLRNTVKVPSRHDHVQQSSRIRRIFCTCAVICLTAVSAGPSGNVSGNMLMFVFTKMEVCCER